MIKPRPKNFAAAFAAGAAICVSVQCAVVKPVLSIPQAAVKSAKVEWILEQEDKEAGKTRVFITDDGVRIVDISRGFEVVATGPSWKVVIFKRKDQACHTTDLKLFGGFSTFGPIGSVWKTKPNLAKVSSGKTNECPFTLSHYKAKSGTDISMIEDIDVEPEVKVFIQDFYHVPVAGIPFRSIYKFPGGVRKKGSNWLSDEASDFQGVKVWLTTSSWKKVPFNSSDFAYPDGYKEVKDPMSILLPSGNLARFNSIMQDMAREDEEKERTHQKIHKWTQ
jgi:hypothetical protein